MKKCSKGAENGCCYVLNRLNFSSRIIQSTPYLQPQGAVYPMTTSETAKQDSVNDSAYETSQESPVSLASPKTQSSPPDVKPIKKEPSLSRSEKRKSVQKGETAKRIRSLVQDLMKIADEKEEEEKCYQDLVVEHSKVSSELEITRKGIKSLRESMLAKSKSLISSRDRALSEVAFLQKENKKLCSIISYRDDEIRILNEKLQAAEQKFLETGLGMGATSAEKTEPTDPSEESFQLVDECFQLANLNTPTHPEGGEGSSDDETD